MELKLNEVEVTKLNLQPGETLVVTVKSEDMSMYDMDDMAKGFRKLFPNNKVAVLNVGTTNEVVMTVVKDLAAESCGSTPSSFCGDCSCGKKEAYEATRTD